MTQSRTQPGTPNGTPPGTTTGRTTGAVTVSPRRTVGIAADSVVKVLLGIAFLAGAGPLGDRLGVATWLMVVSGVALLAGGGTGLGYLRARPTATYLRLMTAYDSCWALATLAGLLVAWWGGEAGGEVWIGYQTVAPLVFAAVLVTASPAPPPSGSRA